MSKTKHPRDEPGPDQDEEGPRPEPTPRTQEEVARALGAAPAGAARPGLADESMREGGRLRLDKSGALAGRPKLQPVKALRKDADDAASGEGGSQEAAPSGPRKAALPPRLGSLRPEGFEPPVDLTAPGARAPMIAIPAGTFLYGEARKPLELPAFSIDTFPVTNADYEAFVEATGHRPPLYWPKGRCPDLLRDHPVVGVDYYDAMAYARWCGKDLPFEDEWERAARGTDGRAYPWGNDQELSGANTQRVGLRMTVPVDLYRANASPDGCRDMVGNVWELTHSPAPGGGVVVRGGSWHDFALYAKTFFRFASRPDARNGTIGFRLVRREADRTDAPREVPPDQVAAEIDARRGPPPPVDAGEWSVERRDLVLDSGRLRTYVAETRAEELLAPKRGVAVTLHTPAPVAPPPVAPPSRGAPARATVQPPPPAVVPPPPPAAPPAPPAPPAERAAASLHVPESGDDGVERIHVGTAEPPPAVPKPRAPASPEATPAPATRPPTRVRPPRTLPRTMWVLLVVGFLLLGGLVAVLVRPGGDEPSQGADTPRALSPVPGRLAELPEPLGDESFPLAGRPARVLDLLEPGDRARLERGTWLLLFVDDETPEGQQTLRAAQGMHRRLAALSVQVAVVLARAPYADADGRLPDETTLAERLRVDSRENLWDGILVLLDPVGPDGRTQLAARTCRADEPVAAVLLHAGRRESRTSPPSGGLNEEALASIAQHALRLAAPDR